MFNLCRQTQKTSQAERRLPSISCSRDEWLQDHCTIVPRWGLLSCSHFADEETEIQRAQGRARAGVRPAELKPDGPRSHWQEPLCSTHREPSSSFLHTRGRRAKNCLRMLPAPTHNPEPGGIFLALHSLLRPVGWPGRSWALLPAIIQGPRLLPSHGSSALLGVLREAHSRGFNGPVQSGAQTADQGSVPRPHLTQGSLGDDVWGFVGVGEVAGSSANILGKLYFLLQPPNL